MGGKKKGKAIQNLLQQKQQENGEEEWTLLCLTDQTEIIFLQTFPFFLIFLKKPDLFFC